MNKSEKSGSRSSRSVMATMSNWALTLASPTRAGAISSKDDPDIGRLTRSDLSVDLAIASFKTLNEATEVVPVVKVALKASIVAMVSTLRLIKRCKKDGGDWERLAAVLEEKNDSITMLLNAYAKLPERYPNTETQAAEYQRILDDIASDMKQNTQAYNEVSEGVDVYWSKMLSTGGEAVVAKISSDKIASYRGRLEGIVFDMVEGTAVRQARVFKDGTTIEESFRRLSSRVQRMMRLFSHLDGLSIARCIIEKAAERKFLYVPRSLTLPLHSDTGRHSRILQSIFCSSGVWKASKFDEMIEECVKHSLLQTSITDGETFYSMEPPVQSYLQSTSGLIQKHPIRHLIVRLLASATTDARYDEYFGFNQLLAPHIRLVRLEDVTEGDDHFGFGRFLFEMGDPLAIVHWQRCVSLWKDSLGDKAVSTVNATSELAASYKAFGREMEALPLQEEVVEKRRAIFGPDHFSTHAAMNNLATTYVSLARPKDALPLQAELVQRWGRVYGPDNINTLLAIHNLAGTYQILGRFTEALPLQEQVLQKRRTFLGPDHLDTLNAMYNLGCNYNSLGRESDALPLYQEIIDKRRSLLGPGHRDTVNAMYNLLVAYSRLGMKEELQALARTTLPLCEGVYDSEQEKTLWVRSLLD